MKLVDPNILKSLMKEKDDLSSRELARRIGRSPATITNILNGNNTDPRLSTVSRISNVLGCKKIDDICHEIADVNNNDN